jgi:hypothetical protein
MLEVFSVLSVPRLYNEGQQHYGKFVVEEELEVGL